MADQNFMDLASKTASGIAGTDYMMLVNNSEAYKALVNDVAEAILSKLTSKSFSGLETTAKNVIGALNELNSKSKNGWPSASGQSFEEVIPANFPPGLYAYRNILGIPGSSKDPSMNFARIIKMTEAVIVIISGSMYYREASDGTWNENWKKITATDVSVTQ